jgi:hypothetical protein
VAGASAHWALTGYGTIYAPTKDSFIISARSLIDWNNTLMLNYSQTYEWDVNWFGISY